MTTRILSLRAMREQRLQLRESGQTLVLTNGCFDLIHRGHTDYLEQARALGDVLVVGLNDDESVRRLKGRGRPLQPLADRAALLLALRAVDFVVPFPEDTPAKLVLALVPDVLVKGGDYELDQIVGRETVEAAGGRVERIPFRPGYSTSSLIERIRELLGAG
jgi:D-beta-D-heptose 7-phosphate kinase/D-beta-D-heptose 1-phosphate adenosyltransferase